jgi:hypothetical protein
MNNLKVSYLCINYELMLWEGGGVSGYGDGHALYVIAQRLQRQSSWWWAVCRSKHVEPSMNGGIINYITRLQLVGYLSWGTLLSWWGKNDSYASSVILRPRYEIKQFRSFSRSDAPKAMGHDATEQKLRRIWSQNNGADTNRTCPQQCTIDSKYINKY